MAQHTEGRWDPQDTSPPAPHSGACDSGLLPAVTRGTELRDKDLCFQETTAPGKGPRTRCGSPQAPTHLPLLAPGHRASVCRKASEDKRTAEDGGRELRDSRMGEQTGWGHPGMGRPRRPSGMSLVASPQPGREAAASAGQQLALSKSRNTPWDKAGAAALGGRAPGRRAGAGADTRGDQCGVGGAVGSDAADACQR